MRDATARAITSPCTCVLTHTLKRKPCVFMDNQYAGMMARYLSNRKDILSAHAGIFKVMARFAFSPYTRKQFFVKMF
jgi:hypothetical protein